MLGQRYLSRAMESPFLLGLRALLGTIYSLFQTDSIDLIALKKGLEELLEFLANEGRTNANCWAVDLFFAISQGWERDWTEQNLPDDFHDVFAMMGSALHDTVRSPEFAQNFDCLPEQLLGRVNRLRPNAADSQRG